MLPGMVHADGIRKQVQTKFGGYDHRRGAGDGTLWDMENLTARDTPLLASRAPRHLVRRLTKPNGFAAYDELYWVDGTDFYAGGVLTGTVTDSPKTFAQLGAYLVIFPDKAYYNRETDEFGNLEESFTGNAKFTDGTIWGEPAEGCSIVRQSGTFAFRAGDAVEITAADPANCKTAVIREISEDGTTLTFYENSFVTTSAWASVTVKRSVPDMDFLCVNENRLWGCKGDTVYASKLGDPFNFNVYDGISTDSYAAAVGSEGDFTGACAYLGYPCFFKENHIYKVYGDRPSNFQVMAASDLGTAKGSGASFGVAGAVLYYLSRAGIVAFSGGVPEILSAPFGDVRYHDAVGGSDGIRYFVSMADDEGARSLFVYDTRYNVWHREDDFDAAGFGWLDGFWGLDRAGGLWRMDEGNLPAGSTEEDTVHSFAEFADFTEERPERKGSSHIEIRAELEAGSTLRILLQYDSDGVWREIKTLRTDRKRSFYLPVIPRRCDHMRLRLEGTGMWRLYSLTRNLYLGSEIH